MALISQYMTPYKTSTQKKKDDTSSLLKFTPINNDTLLKFTPVNTAASNKPATPNTKGKIITNSLADINTNDILNNYSSMSSGGGGAPMIDISGILSAYEQEAQSNRDIAKQQYESTRGDLLTSLKRFQEENAKNVERQQKNYLSNQASIESAIAQADRQNRISAAARGLAGSGLQQLAQLQNLLNQGQTISDMATENQEAMDALRTALANREEDTNTAVQKALDTYNNALSSINSSLASNKANIEYQARENAASRAASYASARDAQNAANQELANSLSQEIASSQEALNRTLSSVNEVYNTKKKNLKNMVNPYTGETYGTTDINKIRQSIYEGAQSNARDVLKSYAVNANSNISNNFLNNLLSIYQTGGNTTNGVNLRSLIGGR